LSALTVKVLFNLDVQKSQQDPSSLNRNFHGFHQSFLAGLLNCFTITSRNNSSTFLTFIIMNLNSLQRHNFEKYRILRRMV
jgi:hypothetical protein